jgi:hypothetical protein
MVEVFWRIRADVDAIVGLESDVSVRHMRVWRERMCREAHVRVEGVGSSGSGRAKLKEDEGEGEREGEGEDEYERCQRVNGREEAGWWVGGRRGGCRVEEWMRWG